MHSARTLGVLGAMLAVAGAWLLLSVSGAGDWPVDSGPAVDALVHGRIADYLSARAMMGSFATLVQAPFAALGGSGLAQYRWASIPGLLAVALLGLYLAAVARRRGAPWAGQALICLLCLLNPLTLEALQNGHPEELLTAALAVGAVATATQGHAGRAGLLLGLALATKQWAVIAILPVLMALPDRRPQAAVTALAVAGLLTLPSVLMAPGTFMDVQGNAAATGQVVTPWSVWYPFASVSTEVYEVGSRTMVASVRELPAPIGSLSHPLIVALAFGLPLGIALLRGRFRLSGSDAMTLLALLALLRCALDPVGNLYYHEPLLLALIGWDALASRGLPLRALLGTGVALIFWRSWHSLGDPGAFNAVYIGFALLLVALLSSSLFGQLRGRAFRSAQFSREVTQISRIKELSRRPM